MKASYRRRISESTSMRKDTVDKDIPITSRISNGKIVTSIKMKGLPRE